MSRLLLSASLLISLAAPPAFGNLLANGSFEAVAVTADDECLGFAWCLRSPSGAPGWTQFADGVDLIHNNFTSPLPKLVDASAGMQFIDLNQGGYALSGGLFQEVSATPGQAYRLSLDTTAWAANSLGGTTQYALYDPVTVAILAIGIYSDTTGGEWVRRDLEAVATSSSLGVRIFGLVSAGAGMGVDNVVLTAIPEPGSMALMLSGLTALALLTRRRRLPSRTVRVDA